MPSFNPTPASFVDLNNIFPTLNEKVGLSAEQFRVVVENIYWNFNHLSQANIDIGTVTVHYGAPGSPFDVEITHTGEYDEHHCLIRDVLNFEFTIAVAAMTASGSAEISDDPEGCNVVITPTPLADNTGYNFDFAFTIPRGNQGVKGVSFRNKGSYNSTLAYVNNDSYIDFVHYQGSLYCPCVAETTPGTLPTDASEWTMMVRRGYGITTIEKTGTSGLIDTYTITFESGTTTTFQVTNGYTQDISGKADKVEGATNGNFASLDADGNLVDSGHKPSDYLTEHQDISGKADKVTNPSVNDITVLNAQGNYVASGKKISDFLAKDNDTAYTPTSNYHPSTKKYTDDTVKASRLLFTNVVASSWSADTTYADFGYKCELTTDNVSSSDFAEVTFNVANSTSGNYAPVCLTGTNKITIYSKVNTTITIPSIVVIKGV